MPTCADIEPLITAFLDSQATPDERAAVGEHLRECARCRSRAADEDAGRRILRERAASFRVEAPSGLRQRCAPPPAAAVIGSPGTWWLRPVVRRTPLWAAALLVLAILTGTVAVAGRQSTVLAAGLALDHLKCFALFENASGPDNPRAIAARLKTDYGWTVAVPAASAALGLRLVGGRRCLSTDGRVAHILYRHDGRPLSLFVLPGSSRAAEQFAVIGYRAIMWSRNRTTYVVVSSEPRPAVAPVAAYLQAATGR